MKIVEETTALGVPFCHFKTTIHRNQYNLTFTKTNKKNTYEVHLIPLLILRNDGKVMFDNEIRKFVCDKIYDFMTQKRCSVYFNINCIGLGNEYLLWKFSRWIKYYDKKVNINSTVTQDYKNSIRFFEFTVSL